MENEQVKFCKDCKFYLNVNGPLASYFIVPGGIDHLRTCRSPQRPITPEFYVNGASKYPDPLDARAQTGFCGPQARYFELAPPPPPPIRIEPLEAPFSGESKPWWKFW